MQARSGGHHYGFSTAGSVSADGRETDRSTRSDGGRSADYYRSESEFNSISDYQTTTTGEFNVHTSRPSATTNFVNAKQLPIIRFDYQCEMFGLQALQNDAFDANGEFSTSQISSPGDQEEKEFFLSERIKPSPFRDARRRFIYLVDVFKDPSLEPLSIPRLLHGLETMVDASVEEITLLRDETYNRVSLSILKRALQYKPASSAQVSPLFEMHPELEEAPVELSAAIAITELLGCKSEECQRLLHSAVFIRDLRKSVLFNSSHETLQMLQRVNELKSLNLFDPAIVTEIDDIFKGICGSNFKNEICRCLGIRVSMEGDLDLDLEHEPAVVAQEEGGDVAPQKVDELSLRTILRNIAAVKDLDQEATVLM